MTIDPDIQEFPSAHTQVQVPALHQEDRAIQSSQQALRLLQHQAMEEILSPSIIPPISITATQRISHTPVQPKLNSKISKVDALTQFRNSLEESDRHFSKKPSPLIRQQVILQGKLQESTPFVQL